MHRRCGCCSGCQGWILCVRRRINRHYKPTRNYAGTLLVRVRVSYKLVLLERSPKRNLRDCTCLLSLSAAGCLAARRWVGWWAVLVQVCPKANPTSALHHLSCTGNVRSRSRSCPLPPLYIAPRLSNAIRCGVGKQGSLTMTHHYD